MAGGVRYQRGGILGLCQLLTEHAEAIRYDLLTVGLRLDDLGRRKFTWVDLLAVVRQSPPTSALARAMHGEYAIWTPDTYLLAMVADQLVAANWQRGGGKGKRPKPLQRPKDLAVKRLSRDELRKNPMQSGVIGTPMTLDAMKEWLRAKNGRS